MVTELSDIEQWLAVACSCPAVALQLVPLSRRQFHYFPFNHRQNIARILLLLLSFLFLKFPIVSVIYKFVNCSSLKDEDLIFCQILHVFVIICNCFARFRPKIWTLIPLYLLGLSLSIASIIMKRSSSYMR